MCVYVGEGDCLTVGTRKRRELLKGDTVAADALLLELCRMEALLLALSHTL